MDVPVRLSDVVRSRSDMAKPEAPNVTTSRSMKEAGEWPVPGQRQKPVPGFTASADW